MTDCEAAVEADNVATAALKALKESSLNPEQETFAQLALDKLVNAFIDAKSSEASWRFKAEALHSDLQVYEAQVAKAEDNVIDHTSPAGLAKQELLKASNELTLLSSLISDAEAGVDTLKDERSNLTYEIELARESLAERHPELEEVKNQKQQIENDRLKHEVALRSLTDQQHELNKIIEQLNAEAQDQQQALSQLQHTLNQHAAEPARLSNQCSMMESSLTRLQRTHEEITAKLQQHQQRLEQAEEDVLEAQSDLISADQALSASHDAYDQTARALQQHELTLSQSKDSAADEMGQRAMLEAQLRQLNKDLAAMQVTVSQRNRTKEHKLKALKAAQLREEALKEATMSATAELSALQTTLVAKRKEAIDFSDIMTKLQTEVEAQQRSWEGLSTTAQSAVTVVNQMASREKSLEKELAHESRKATDLQRKVSHMKRAVDKANVEQLKSLTEHQHQLQSLTTIQQAQREAKRDLVQVQRRLRNTQRMHAVVKGERTACLTQINAVQQRTAELQDKARILSTEIEILKASAVEKGQRLDSAKADAAAQIGFLEQQRHDINLLRSEYMEATSEQKSSAAINRKQLEAIEALEKKLLKLREDHSNVIKQRNMFARTLMHRQNELMQLYDQLNLQAETIHKGEMGLNERSQDVKLLNAERTELERAIGLMNKNVPKQKQLQQDLLDAQLELAAVQKQVERLEEQLQSPEQTQRWRVLPGADQDAEDLERKLSDLAHRLADKETQSLERELVLAETIKLCNRTQARLDTGRGHTLKAAKTVRDYQIKLEELNRKLMAVVSELSMYQAKALREQQQLQDLREGLATAQANMLAGKPPNDDAVREWARQERRMKQEAQAREASMQQVPPGTQLDEDTITHAPPRPNAYMPTTTGALPIAKPYGAQAPFRPAAAPSHLRHLRASVVRTSVPSS
eukprot:TRINITY_DN8202_c0_g1_i1.p1 TRINITY_DN8202_c0_g1~~TRINITY_DN8202_c0_g1_i1.p1  ORF type:complete len:924 (+),score=322.05 TRINITY_DN8202_c0_g1_i1:74-2845(+)